MAINRGPATRRAHLRCARVVCSKWFRPIGGHTGRAKYCSRACAAANRPRASYVAAGRKGGRANAENHRGVRLAALKAMLAPLTKVEAWIAGRKRGLHRLDNHTQAAYRRGISDGFERGYEQAQRELRWRRSA